MSFELFRKEVSDIVGAENSYLLEVPRDGMGDLAMPCFALAKKFQKSPAELAQMIAIGFSRKIDENSLVSEVKASGPYVNFYINGPEFAKIIIKEILSKKEMYGSSDSGKGKTVVLDYSHPNIAKPMSVGHLRTTIIGNSIYRMLNFTGYKAVGDDHIGDWGTQFGKLIYAYKTWGDPAKVDENPIPELLSLYVKFHEEAEKYPKLEDDGRVWFAKLENGDHEAKKIWEYCVKVSLEAFEKIYKRLGIKFEYVIGESFYVNQAKKIVEKALKAGIAKTDQGAVIIDSEGSPIVIRKSDESTLYSSRDLATIEYRMKEFAPFRILYVVGAEQSLYFRQVFHAARMLGLMNDEAVHVSFGLVSLPEGRMSTRKGRVIFAEDLLNETIKCAETVIADREISNKKEIAERVGIASVKYNILSVDRIRDIVFDWEQALSFEGDTGPYLLYTVVRAKSIVEKSRKKPSVKDIESLATKEELEIMKTLSKFGSSIEDSLKTYKPHVLANYLYKLASQFNEYYHKTKIIDTKEEQQRLALVQSFVTVMENGLSLLGIEVPDRM